MAFLHPGSEAAAKPKAPQPDPQKQGTSNTTTVNGTSNTTNQSATSDTTTANGTSNTAAPSNSGPQTSKQLMNCSNVASNTSANSFQAAQPTIDQAAVTAIGIVVAIFGRGQTVQAAGKSAGISALIRTGYYLAKSAFQYSSAYTQCVSPGSDGFSQP